MKLFKSLPLAKHAVCLVLLGITVLVYGVCLLLSMPPVVIEVTHERAMPRLEIWTAEVTGYSSTKDQTDDSPFITASGTKVRLGIVACPRTLPFGTKVKIQGRIYECTDRMAKKYNDRFDIWHPTKGDALAWGKQTLAVEILR